RPARPLAPGSARPPRRIRSLRRTRAPPGAVLRRRRGRRTRSSRPALRGARTGRPVVHAEPVRRAGCAREPSGRSLDTTLVAVAPAPRTMARRRRSGDRRGVGGEEPIVRRRSLRRAAARLHRERRPLGGSSRRLARKPVAHVAPDAAQLEADAADKGRAHRVAVDELPFPVAREVVVRELLEDDAVPGDANLAPGPPLRSQEAYE